MEFCNTMMGQADRGADRGAPTGAAMGAAKAARGTFFW